MENSAPSDDFWCAPGGHQLRESHKSRILDDNDQGWLDDEIITAAMKVLKLEHPHIDGLLPSSVFYGQSQVSDEMRQDQLCWLRNHAWTPRDNNGSRRMAQILYTGAYHWVLVTNYHQYEENLVYVYDSKEDLPTEILLNKIAAVFRFENNEFRVRWPRVDQQKNGKDCGIFAIAYLLAVCRGLEPRQLKFSDSSVLRNHLYLCCELGTFSVAESFPLKQKVHRKNMVLSRFASFMDKEKRKLRRSFFLKERTVELTCFCRMPTGRGQRDPMVLCKSGQCDIEKFHLHCLLRTAEDAGSWETWICAKCEYKRRQPAA